MTKILRWFDLTGFTQNRKQYWGAITVLLLFTILYNGAGLIPFEAYQRLSLNPFITRTDIDANNYFQETVFLPLLANLLHLTSRLKFNLLCLLLILAGYLIVAYNLRKSSTGVNPLPEFAFLLISPITTVLFSWVGSPDGVTFLLTSILLFSKSDIVIFILGILGAANHSIFIFAAIPLLMLRRYAHDDHISTRSIIVFITGSISGLLLAYLFLRINHISVVSRLDFLLQQDPHRWIQINLYKFPAAIYSLNGFVWMAILLIYSKKWDNKRYYRFYLLAMAGFYVITFFTLDTSRVFTLMSWGMTSHLITKSLRGNDPNSQKLSLLVPFICLFGLLMPKYFLWDGNIVFTPFQNFYSSLLPSLLSRLHP
jgi:hypothetical protein